MLIDSHIHLDDPRFDSDRSTLLSKARTAGVSGWVVPAIAAQFWARLSAVCTAHTNAFATYGIHPLFLADFQHDHLDQLAVHLQGDSTGTAPAVAVGECGLDFYRVKDRQSEEAAVQRRVFDSQLHLAKAAELPIIIHARGAVEEVILMIRDSGHRCGVIHSYNGSYEQAKRLLDLGYLLGFGGAVTYSRATRLRELVSRLPADALLLETDAPDQPDATHSELRHVPERLPIIASDIAALRQTTAETLAEMTTANARRLFNLELMTGDPS